MKYKIKVGNKYLTGMNVKEKLKWTTSGDTNAVCRSVGEMSAYDFCDKIEDADAKDAVTAWYYVRGIMGRQKYGFYLGEIKLIDADAEETVAHCKKEENATLIAMILDADADGKVWALDFYENHIEPPKEERVMTNADKIRAKSDEELEAWFLANCAAAANNSCSGCRYDMGSVRGCSFESWLKMDEGTRRGKWIPLATGDYSCDQCHYGFLARYNYCPHCGAAMEE